jgi:hypothetical protein
MKFQRHKSGLKGIFNEATLRKIAEVQTSTSIVVLVQISIVVLTCCRIVVCKYFRKPVNHHQNKDLQS